MKYLIAAIALSGCAHVPCVTCVEPMGDYSGVGDVSAPEDVPGIERDDRGRPTRVTYIDDAGNVNVLIVDYIQ